MNAKDEGPLAEDTVCETPERFFHDIKIEFLIHELKTPMALVETAVRAMLEAREIYGELTPRQEKALNRALRNTQKMRIMVHDLLEIGRSEAGCFICRNFNPVEKARAALVDATEAIRWEAQGAAPADFREDIDWQRYGINLVIDEGVEDAVMRQDEVKYRQIISNLVKNALHHRRQWIEMHLAVENERFRIEIKDDGPGIAAEHQQLIFRRYAQIESDPTLTRRGHGLGLAGARILARCLGGDIAIESELHKGAAFIVDLPLQFSPEER